MEVLITLPEKAPQVTVASALTGVPLHVNVG